MEARSPAISPDGTEIVFTGYKGDNNDIYVMDAADSDGAGNGDNLRRLTNDWANDDSPTWSPDGKKITFSSDIEDGDDLQEPDIYVMNADGSKQTNLTSRPGEDPDRAHEVYPAFSPDGRKIAFSTSRHYQEGAFSAEGVINVMNTEGSNETRLTPTADMFPPTPLTARRSLSPSAPICSTRTAYATTRTVCPMRTVSACPTPGSPLRGMPITQIPTRNTQL
jgi:Tol biopolymer transport system component